MDRSGKGLAARRSASLRRLKFKVWVGYAGVRSVVCAFEAIGSWSSGSGGHVHIGGAIRWSYVSCDLSRRLWWEARSMWKI